MADDLARRRSRLIFARPELRIMAALALVAMVAFTVSKLASEISEGDTSTFDRATLIWLRATFGDLKWLRTSMLDVTALGDPATLTLVVVVFVGYLFVSRQRGLAFFIAVATILGTSLTSILKPWFGRARPDVVSRWGDFTSASFPSGHATNSSVVYLTIAIVASRLQCTTIQRVYLTVIAVVLVLAIGFSRLYLGVHWPTDVLAGWTIGAGWALLMSMVLNTTVYNSKLGTSCNV